MENNESKSRELNEQELESAVGGVSKAFGNRYRCTACGAILFTLSADKKCTKCGGDVVLQQRR